VPVVHASNPSFSGSRQQEDQVSKPARTNSSQDPISKIRLVEWLKVKALISSPSTTKKKKKKRKKNPGKKNTVHKRNNDRKTL
jgi:hypothetical protein